MRYRQVSREGVGDPWVYFALEMGSELGIGQKLLGFFFQGFSSARFHVIFPTYEISY